MIAGPAMDARSEVERERSASTRPIELLGELFIERARRMDDDTWSQIVDLHYDRVFAYLCNRTRNPALAEDLVAQVFTEAVARIGKYEERGLPFAAWLFRIARNISADAFRKQANRAAMPLDVPAESDDLRRLERDVEHEQVREALVTLTEEQRSVLQLRIISECSIAETAATLGKTEGAIKAIQHRALASMRRALHGIDPHSWRQDHGAK